MFQTLVSIRRKILWRGCKTLLISPEIMKAKRVWTSPKLKDIPIFFEVSLYAGTR